MLEFLKSASVKFLYTNPGSLLLPRQLDFYTFKDKFVKKKKERNDRIKQNLIHSQILDKALAAREYGILQSACH